MQANCCEMLKMMRRPEILAAVAGSVLSLACSTSSGGEGQEGCAGVVVGTECLRSQDADWGSDWHPDPDGDGIASAGDMCPHVYDVAQGDGDGDGLGDFCDPDFVTVVEGGPVVDLRAEHVTPYGGWFSMTSPQTTLYGKDFVLAWSRSRGSVSSGVSVAALDSESKQVFRSFAYFGHRLMRPQIVTSMAPGTSYFLSITALDDYDEPVATVGNVIQITTAAKPILAAAGTHPRAFASVAQIDSMKARAATGDARWRKWSQIMGDAALAAQGSTDVEDFEMCISAALLFHGTGEARYRDAALSLITAMQSYWESNELAGNQLRWANSNLAICVDLMWNEMPAATHNSTVAAFLADDEAVSQDRLADTDEFASITRSWVVDGLVACDADGLDADLSSRGCVLLEKGMRAFYGVQLVKARRDEGFFAQSGGGLPDGIGYGWGTSKYWMHTLHALTNAGANLSVYASWIWNNFRSMELYSLTPRRLGYATFGDLDAYDNFSIEPNSEPLFYYQAGLVASQMGLMAQAGLTEHASHAAWHLDEIFPDDDFGYSWALLLFDSDSMERKNNEGLPTAYFDSGLNMFYDRSDWSKNSSYFTFRAGWSGVDHNHEDLGNFQLYRNGVWITHEALGYDGPAARAGGHNVPQLEIDFEGADARPGQFSQDAEGVAPIVRSSSSNAYAFVLSDLTGAYSSGRYHSFFYDKVERHVLWLKPSEANGDDRVFVYDLIDSAPGQEGRVRAWQMHLDQEASIDGSVASFEAGSAVQVAIVYPQGVALSYLPSEGEPSNFPGEIYTSRLEANAQSSETALRYLSVVRASSESNSIANTSVSSSDVIGVLSGADLVIFPRAAEGGNTAELSVDVSGLVDTIWWTGLDPNALYSVDKSGETYTLKKGGSQRSDRAGVLVWP